MSLPSSSEFPSNSSERSPFAENGASPRSHALARLDIRLDIDPAFLALVTSEAARLLERFLPGIPHVLGIDGKNMRLRTRKGVVSVSQADLLAGRLARSHGVLGIRAELRTVSGRTVYSADIRGRTRPVNIAG